MRRHLLAQGMASVAMKEDMKEQMLSRREFNGLRSGRLIAPHRRYNNCGAGFCRRPRRGFERFKAYGKVPRRNNRPGARPGLWGSGAGRRPEAVEEEALRTCISLGMTLIDTAEVYGNGRSEKLIGRVIAIAVWNTEKVFHVADFEVGHAPGANRPRRT